MKNTSKIVQIGIRPKLNLKDAVYMVVGSMIGSGIFIVAADMTRNLGSAGWLILVWVITGVMTMIAAVSYGELSGMFPNAGGQYIYLKEAFNPLIGFLYGWSFFSVIQSGLIAAVAVSFAKFSAYFVPQFSESRILFEWGKLTVSSAQLLAISMIILLSFLNTRGVSLGKFIQKIFTLTKLASLFGLILFGFLLANKAVWTSNWSNAFNMHRLNANGTMGGYTFIGSLGAIAAAMVGSIFASDAWNTVTFIGGEVSNPRRNIGLSLFLGTLIVTVIYILTNIMYTAVLPMQAIAASEKDRVAVTAALSIFGRSGTGVIAAMIIISTFGCNNGLILSGARVYCQMARDGLFLRRAGKLNGKEVPGFSLWIQCAMASLLCISGKYGDLLDMISFVVMLFYILCIAGIFVLRQKRPEADRPYRAFGYPILPVMYIVLALCFCGLLIVYKPNFTWGGLIVVLLGLPIYYFFINRNFSEKSLDETALSASGGKKVK